MVGQAALARLAGFVTMRAHTVRYAGSVPSVPMARVPVLLQRQVVPLRFAQTAQSQGLVVARQTLQRQRGTLWMSTVPTVVRETREKFKDDSASNYVPTFFDRILLVITLKYFPGRIPPRVT
jgi:hypothetical protein